MNLFFIFGAQYLYLIIALIAGVFFFKQPRNVQKHMALFAVIALPAIYITAKIGNMFYNDPRPFVVGNFVPLIPHAPDNGFPSDHTLISSAIAAIVFPFNKKLSLFLWTLALLVGLSRVFVGVHHLVDILGSMVIAGLVGYGVFLFITKVLKKSLTK